MSTQKIRSEIKTKISSVISKAKIQLKQEGKKKVLELKKQIPTPEEVLETLKSNIDFNSCSDRGKSKFLKKHNKLTNSTTKVQGILDKSITTLDNMQSKLEGILNDNGVLNKIQNISTTLSPITTTLNIVVQGVNTLISSIGSIPPPATAPSGPLIMAKDASDKAKSKIAEYSSLILAIPEMVNIYSKKAEDVLDDINYAISELSIIKKQIDKIILYLLYLKLKFESDCQDFETTIQNSNNNNNNILIPNPSIRGLTLEQLLKINQDLYDGMLNSLLAQGNTKALEKVTLLQKSMEEWVKIHNISFKIINISTPLTNADTPNNTLIDLKNRGGISDNLYLPESPSEND